MEIFEYFLYPPIVLGFTALIIAGATFPIAGVFIIQLNLVPMRFMLMHVSLLGGAIALSAVLPQSIVIPFVNMLFVGIMAAISRARFRDLQYANVFLMVVSVALAFLVIQKSGVPAKDTLVLLWGSIFALHISDLVQIIIIGSLCVGYLFIAWTPVIAVLYNKSVAVASGVRYSLHFNLIVIFIGVAIGAAMRLVGALLLDSILLLPAIIGIKTANSLRNTFLYAALAGLCISVFGFLIALQFDLPVSGSITIFAAAVFAAVEIAAYMRSKK